MSESEIKEKLAKIKSNTNSVNVLALENGDLEFLIKALDQLLGGQDGKKEE